MTQAQGVPGETELLFNASSQLTRAATPLEQLEAVSDYARNNGASSGVLFYFEFEAEYRIEEVIAEWVVGHGIPYEVGTRFRLPQASNWLTPPTGPILAPDIRTTENISAITREIDLNHNIYASVILPLYSRGRWVAAVLFGWNEPQQFNEHDRRVYTVLQQLAAPVVDSVRLFEQTQKRAAELETAQYEMDILYAISRQLVRAMTPSEILEAVSAYARARGACYARLSYFVDFQPHWLEVVATWSSEGESPTPVGTIVDVSKRKLPQYSMSRPDRPTFVADLQDSAIPSPDMRQHAALFNVRSVVQLPMYINGRWIGILTFDWNKPQVFDERDERIFAALQQQVAPVIDSIRLLDQSRTRMTELEQANQEINLLYRTSEIINSANTYEEVVEAVAQFDPDADTVTLMLWENLDWSASSFLEVMVVIDRMGKSPIKAGDRLPTENFPIANVMSGERVWIFEDARTDARIDPVTAQTWELLNIRAFMGPALYIQHRWAGGITFHSSQPRQYSERETRLFAGVGDLVIAAIQRIRYQQETEAAKDEIDVLYRVGEVINVASSFAELVNALSSIVSSAEAVALHVWEGWSYEKATHVETVAGTGYMQSLVGHRIPIEALSFTEQTLNDRILVIEDVTSDPRFDTATIAGFLQRRQVASISIRLHVNQQWIGALVFQNDKPRTFSEREKRLAVGIGDYVMGAVERIRAREETEAARHYAEVLAQSNVKLFEQTQRRALELEAAKDEIDILYRVGEAINTANSFGELVNALSGIISGATAVALFLWEGWDFKTATYLEAVAATGFMSPYIGHRISRETFPIVEHIYDEPLLVVEDVLTDPRMTPAAVTSYHSLGLRAFVSILLYTGSRRLGSLAFNSSTPHVFSERERRLALGIGDYVLGAVERIRLREETDAARQRAEALAQTNTHLLEQTQRRATELEAAKEEIDTLYRVGEAINAANSFTELVNALSGIISGATAVGLYRWEGWDFETATYAEAIAATGYMLPLVGQRTSKEALAYTHDTQGDRLLVVEDTATHPIYDDTTKAAYVERDMLAQISIRLYVNQRWIGALVFHSTTPRSFSEQEQRLALGIGDYVLGAVERIRAREETEAARQRAEALAEQAHQLAVLEERNRLARELHDSVSQALYGIALGAQTARTILDRDPQQAVEPLDYVLALSEAGLAEMRALIFELRPETLEKEGLIEALSKQVVMLQARHGFEVKTAFCPEPNISIQLKEAVYWIAREALHNVVKHANASTIELRVSCTADLFTLSVMDNGTGFDVDADFSGHLGLKSMSERALRIGCTLNIRSGSGAGTHIQLQLPLDAVH